MHPNATNLSPLEQRFLLAGCHYDAHRRAWRCPVCRRRAVLRLLRQPDASHRIDCASGCAAGDVLETLGASYFDVGPACFRRGSGP